MPAKKSIVNASPKINFQPNILQFSPNNQADGIEILNDFTPWVSSFCLSFTINTGTAFELPFPNGISHLAEHIVFRGTKHYSGKKIAAEFEKIGSYLNAYTTKETTTFYVRGLVEHFDTAFKLLHELVFLPEFNAKDLDKEKKIIKEEISSYDDDPEEFAFEMTENIIYNGTALSEPILGTIESLDQISIEILEQYIDERYRYPYTSIICSGNVSDDKLLENTKRVFILDKKMNKSAYSIPESHHLNSDIILRTVKQSFEKSYSQYQCLFSKVFDNYKFEDKVYMQIFTTLLGDSMSSRLYRQLREKSGLAYTVYSALSFFKDNCYIGFFIAGDKKKANKIKMELEQIINSSLEKPFSELELSIAKAQLKSSIVFDLENIATRNEYMVKNIGNFTNEDSLEKQIEIINQVNLEEISKYINEKFVNIDWNIIETI